jgi:predicted RNA-binding Zn-ribbon protein involved in translation (DUF1610 family)
MQRPVVHTYRRPVVVGTRDEAIRLCGICLGELRCGLPFALCDCGKLYHVTCGFRVGVCVSCGRQMEERMRADPEGWEGAVEARDGHPPATHHPALAAASSKGIFRPWTPVSPPPEGGPSSSHSAPSEGIPRQPPGVDVRPSSTSTAGHGLPPAAPAAARLTPKEKLHLLEERLLTGHVSETLYRELRAKFEAELSALVAADNSAPVQATFSCPECGETLASDAGSCTRCGVRFAEADGFACPECGAALEASARKCACGAEFTDTEAEFSCPMCGTVQGSEVERCVSCGAEFTEELHELEYECPECGRTVEESAEGCECGAVFDRAAGEGTTFECPGCGSEVSKEDTFCPRCGVQFANGG